MLSITLVPYLWSTCFPLPSDAADADAADVADGVADDVAGAAVLPFD